MELPMLMATGTLPAQEPTRNPWLQPSATLLKPYTIEELLNTVRNVLHASDSLCEPIPPLPKERRQPSAEGWQF